MERDIAKPLIKIATFKDAWHEVYLWACPNCGKKYTNDFDNYCSKCGQKLKEN